MKKKDNLPKLYAMIIIVPKGKKEAIGDILERFDVTSYLSTLSRGTMNKDLSREVLMCAIKEEMIKDCILSLEDKFEQFKEKSCMVYTVPFDSIIGVSNYMALSKGGM